MEQEISALQEKMFLLEAENKRLKLALQKMSIQLSFFSDQINAIITEDIAGIKSPDLLDSTP